MSFSILIKEDVCAIQFQTPNIIHNAPPKISSLSNDKWTLITKDVGDLPRSVIVGDANNDGQNDIITVNNGDNTISILLWNIKPPPTEESGGPFPIPGYNIIFLLSTIGVILIIIINKSLKDRKPLDNKP